MKIEKISDNQIRCTLSHKDLEDRELKLSELAYGTAKAKELFKDMMQQASYQFGFEADDIPLMIEAIPVSRETLILVITKVEDPDELDTRFSRFSPDPSEEDESDYYEGAESISEQLFNAHEHLKDLLVGANSANTEESADEDVYEDDFPFDSYSDNSDDNRDFVPLSESLGISKKASSSDKDDNTDANTDIIRVFSFDSLDDVTKLSAHINCIYKGDNTVYKNSINSKYYLVMHRTDHAPEEFNKICNLASEYGHVSRSTYATVSHFDEHFTVIVKNNAIQVLASL
ncbi:MAG: adaptor protein MecA [Lachnospiraceae bacterium]|nr:adaptor protein MecA [Lachnospiraceae bacterium]